MLGDDADETKPQHILCADRSMTGFEFSGLHDNTACYTVYTPNGGNNARFDKDLCHGASGGNVGLSDGSAQQLNRSSLTNLVRSIPSSDTIDGSLRFYIP